MKNSTKSRYTDVKFDLKVSRKELMAISKLLTSELKITGIYSDNSNILLDLQSKISDAYFEPMTTEIAKVINKL